MNFAYYEKIFEFAKANAIPALRAQRAARSSSPKSGWAAGRA